MAKEKELSPNFEKEVLRREKPACYGKFKVKTEDKETGKAAKKVCGMCWFNPYCRSGKTLPRKKTEVKKEEGQQELIK